jgi:enoyl-CoA hydratase/carnithine racemase
MVALSRTMGRKHALEMLLLGDMVDAQDACRFGLVNRVVPAGHALDAARRMADSIASRSPLTVRVGKRAFTEQAEMGLADAYAHATRVMVDNMLARTRRRAIGAFMGSGPPVWEGR